MFRYHSFSGGRRSQQCVGLLASWLALSVVASVSRCDSGFIPWSPSAVLCGALIAAVLAGIHPTAILARCHRHGAAGSCWIPDVVVTTGSSVVDVSHIGLSYVSLTIVAAGRCFAPRTVPVFVAVVDQSHCWIVVADLSSLRHCCPPGRRWIVASGLSHLSQSWVVVLPADRTLLLVLQSP